jgi:hypothetical protein
MLSPLFPSRHKIDQVINGKPHRQIISSVLTQINAPTKSQGQLAKQRRRST